MKSLWKDEDAREYVERFKAAGEDVALRVYTSRLIGRDPALVMHGGGNTSVKGTFRNLLGDAVSAIFVKGSGWNLDSIEPPGFPGLDLEYLKRLRNLPALDDTEMVNQLRTHMFDAAGPNPSVETLLHAFLPHKFIDHSHADAILALTNRPDGESVVRELYGDRIGVVPYVMPGFDLAKVCAEVLENNPRVEGLVLLKHGLFSFGESARQSYDRHIALVTTAEQWLERERKRGLTPRFDAPAEAATLCARVAPVLRGLLAEATGEPDQPWRRMVLEWRASDEILDFVNAAEFEKLALTGPLTPDHVIRTKSLPMIVAEPDFDNIAEQLQEAVTAYRRIYNAYFDDCVRRKGVQRIRLDDYPRVVLMPGVGMLCWGATKKDARIAADIYEHTIRVKTLVHASGEYEALPEGDLFDVEYWPLEQAKLGKSRPKPLAGQVAIVTGAAGAIGSAVCECLIEAGAQVVAADINAERLAETCDELAQRHGKDSRRGVVCDVTDEASVAALFDECARLYGGVDVVVPNAGVAHSRPLDELEPEDFKRVMDVNATGYFHVMRQAAKVLRAQGTGGNIIVIGSKNVPAPGAEFAAYSASKAAGHQLARVAALELAKDGVRVNIVAPDAVFGDGGHASGLWAEVGPDRAKAHGIDFAQLEEHYRNRNLLRARVTGRHVGNAVVFFASNRTPTTGASLPVDGGIANAFPR
ncbi:MAG: bifunctional aldolase/short-chain dehydrogenase [Planctomycetes bacterium]|nr:bifunctional aldolase/short-chain dehydrogenase [Planctomycetota bacterium]MCW8135075.1 bifunctional aldolase/short-chain dehydrogenase [Planctomycetota bacterium]